jgi:hypothetical protein
MNIKNCLTFDNKVKDYVHSLRANFYLFDYFQYLRPEVYYGTSEAESLLFHNPHFECNLMHFHLTHKSE